jgi:hypothetical protein
VESLEKPKQLSQAFHRPLEISQKARDFHIPTARLRGPGKVENQKQVFHFPTAARDDDSGSLSETKKTKERTSAATRPPHSPIPLSLRSTGTDFMLILRLENAGARATEKVVQRHFFTAAVLQ